MTAPRWRWIVPCLIAIASVAAAPAPPAVARLEELLARLRAGDDGALRGFVAASFTEAMRRSTSSDPGIVPFLTDLARRTRGFDLLRTIVPAPDHVIAVVRSVAQPERILRINLTVETAPPHRVEGLFLLPAEAEDLPSDAPTLSADAAIVAYGAALDRLVAAGGFSGVALLARGSEVVVQRAAGEADRSHHVANKPDTVFGIASMSKMFTAVAIAKLVEQGRIGWSDRVDRHLQGWLPDDLAARVTVERLLTHTSGLGDYLDRIESDPKLRAARSLSAYRELVRDSKVGTGEPKDELRYGNTGYVVLGALIEAVSGRDYFDFVRSELFVPAGMTRTDTWCRDEIVEHRATGYLPPEDSEAMGLGRGWRSNHRFEGTRGTSAGGGMSTAGDLLRFARALVEGKLLKPETLAALVKPRVRFLPGSRYGYGFVVREGIGPKAYGHSGGFPGVQGELRIYDDGAWTLVVLSNVSDGAGEAVSAWDDLVRRVDRGGGPGERPLTGS